MENAEYRDIVLDIYQTVSDPTLWPVVLDRLRDTISARGVVIFEWQLAGDDRTLIAPHFSTNYEPEILSGYLERFGDWEMRDQDLYERQLLQIDGIELISEDVVYNDEAGYLAKPHVQALQKFGIRYRTGSLLDKDNPYRSRFSMQLGEEHGALTPKEHQLLVDILPHVAKAMNLSHQVTKKGVENQALLAIVDRLNVGICLVDKKGRISLSNSEFDRQREEYGAFIVDPTGHLRLHANADHDQYSHLLKDALHHGSHGARPRKEAVVIASQERAGALCVEVVPLNKSDELGTSEFGGTLLISQDTSRPMDIDLNLVSRVYSDLTTTELSVVDMICQGLTNSEIAHQRERSVETVNSQVKAILDKSRATNRTQLVRLLSNFSVPATSGQH